MNKSIKKAQEILKNLGVTEVPVKLDSVAKYLNITIYEKDLPDDISGILDVNNPENPRILVNSNHSTNRKNFSIAHEIGHFLLHHGSFGVHVDRKTYMRDSKSKEGLYHIEIEANKFASELLMPTAFIKKELEGIEDLIDTNDDIIDNLAKKFAVSTTAMSIKFQSLGYSF